MERIQAAIARARENRYRIASGTHPDEPTLDTAIDRSAAWSALPMHRPEPRTMESNRFVSGSGSEEAAAFDVMRTRALKLMQENGWRRVAITSPSPGCGKSTVIVNLGFSLTRREDVSAIIVETDLRRPSLATKLAIGAPYSSADVLRGTAPFADNACRLGPRLAISSTSGPVRNPSDFLQSPQVGTVLDAIEAEYQPTVMLFDMPPLMANDDTLGFLKFVDCALLVAAAEHTTIKEIDTCEREIAAHTNVLGVVLNKCRFTGRKYGYEYY